MGYFVFGVNHKECPVAVREKIHFSASLIPPSLDVIKSFPEISEVVILSTCNRVEFYGFAEDPQKAKQKLTQFVGETCRVASEEFASYLYSYEGREAIGHLFRVAAGLDSLVVGENEILGQLREAFRMANQAKCVHSLLYRLMEKALKNGKAIRAQTKINAGAVSVPSVAVELAEKIFGRLSGEKVMVLGAGEMSLLTMQLLLNAGASILYVVSRDRETGEKIAEKFKAVWVPLDDWITHMDQVDILIASTAAPHVLIHFDEIETVLKTRRHKPLFLIDIAVPRNIESRINTLDDVYLYNIDDLKGVSAANLRLRHQEIEAAEKIIEEAVLTFQSWMEQLAARPALERYENFLDSVLKEEIGRLARATGMNEADQKQIQDRLRSKLLHPPMEKIKEASRNGGVERYVEALHALFHLDGKD